MAPPPSNRHRWVLRSLRIFGFLLATWLILSGLVAYQLTHRRNRPFAEPVPIVSWGQFEPHRLTTSDGQGIGAWYAPGRDEAPSVLLMHGNGGNRGHCLRRAELLAREGCSVLLISLRAHGDSTGEFNDIGYGARNDVVAAVEFLERRRPGRPIVVLGTSLGAAAAVFAAGALGHRVQGYILESPYRDLKIAVRNRTKNELPPILDWIAYRGLLAVSPFVLPNLDRISPIEAIANVPKDVPILILAGDEDISARHEEARALFERIRPHGELQIFEHAGHLQMMETNPARYRRVILGFLSRVASPTSK